MNDKQFDLLVGLVGVTSQPIITAARLVLVNGERPTDASRDTGCKTNDLSSVLVRIKVIHESIKAVYLC